MTPLQEAKIDEIHAMLKALTAGGGSASASSSYSGKPWEGPGGTANDTLLEGQYGNPAVFKTEPKDWNGVSQIGVRASDVPPDYGLAYADMMDRFGEMAKRENKLDRNGKELAWRKFQEAGIFRAWAKRNMAAPKVDRAPYVDETDLPFSGAA